MEESGIVRRIDNLGRIVIPREVRRSLRIKSGDLIEIIIKNNTIILQKNSTLKNLETLAQELVDVINNTLNINIIITDRDSFVVFSGDTAHKVKKQHISKFLERIIVNREYNNEDIKKEIELAENVVVSAYYLIENIVVNGDCAGLIIFLSEERKMEDLHKIIISLVKGFLSKHIED